LDGSHAEQDLLGVLVVAGGGLSAADLADLLDQSEWDVERTLTTVAGRSFRPRLPHWHRGREDVFVLGHEDLQVMARQRFGVKRMAAYLDRLHRWAQKYWDGGWPEDTPEYLLRGYFRLLSEIGDTTRLLACGSDRFRHERLLSVSGGDASALAEVTAAQAALLKAADLAAVARLAVHRDGLLSRNARLPAEVPAVWESLGMHDRADAALGSIVRNNERAALIGLGFASLTAGRHDRAQDATSRALGLSSALWSNEQRTARQLVRLLCALDRVHDAEVFSEQLCGMARAAALVELTRHTGRMPWAQPVWGFVMEPGTDIGDGMAVLADLLIVVSRQGDSGSAGEIMEYFKMFTDPLDNVISKLVTVHLWRAGRADIASAVAALDRLSTKKYPGSELLFEAVAAKLVNAGAIEFVERRSALLPDLSRARVLAAAVRAATETGQMAASGRMARTAEQLITGFANAEDRTSALAALAAAHSHDPVTAQLLVERAEHEARRSLDVNRATLVLADLNGHAHRIGDPTLAARLSAAGWGIVLEHNSSRQESAIYRRAIAKFDRPNSPSQWKDALDRACTTVREADNAEILSLAEILVDVDEPSRALDLAAVALSRLENAHPSNVAAVRRWVKRIEGMAGVIPLYEALCRDQPTAGLMGSLIGLARTAASRADAATAAALLQEARDVANRFGSADETVGALIDVATAAAATGENELAATVVTDAVALCAEVDPPWKRVLRLYYLADVAATIAPSTHGPVLARVCVETANQWDDPTDQAVLLASIVSVSPPQEAVDLALRSFALGGGWITILSLGNTHPDALRAAANEYLALLRG
ncbi:hypothetical protein ACWD8I_13705, partial [Micromonospora arida]